MIGKQCLRFQPLGFGNERVAIIFVRSDALQDDCVKQFGIEDD